MTCSSWLGSNGHRGRSGSRSVVKVMSSPMVRAAAARVGDDLVEVQDLRLGRFEAAEDEQLAGERGGAFGGVADPVDVGALGARTEGVGDVWRRR